MDKLIPDLTAATLPLSGTEQVELWQGGPESVQATLSDVASLVGSSFVPYTGATADVDIGSFRLIAGSIRDTSKTQGSILFAGVGGILSQDVANLSFDEANNILYVGGSTTLNGQLLYSFGSPGLGKILTSDASGNATWQNAPSGYARSINTISNNTTAGSAASTDYYYECTANLTLTLPTAIGNTNEYTIKNNGGITTVNTSSSQTIDGALTAVLSTLYASITLYPSNGNWLIK
jgi:hypothetical protein